MASTPYRENHYVPQWYQRRFVPTTGEQKFRYLDLKPERFRDLNGTNAVAVAIVALAVRALALRVRPTG